MILSAATKRAAGPPGRNGKNKMTITAAQDARLTPAAIIEADIEAARRDAGIK